MPKTWTAIVATATLALAVSACNTVEGAGEDVDSVADKVDEEL
jgi:predicted small secreted protein